MLLINNAWQVSFARVEKNRNAIQDRGWFPYNQNLLLGKKLRETMTKEDQQAEDKEGILPKAFVIIDDNQPSFEQRFLGMGELKPIPRLNFKTGVSKFCLETLVSNKQLQRAQESVSKQVEKGKTIEERLNSLKKITAGQLFKAGSNQIGRTIFEIKKETKPKLQQRRSKPNAMLTKPSARR